MANVILKKGEGRLLKSGGMWIFDNEISKVKGDYKNGDIVNVLDFDDYPMGKGFINGNSKIRVRMLTRNPEAEIDENFFRERVRNAWEYRKKTVDTSCCRVIFGEADFLPGLVVDKFSDVLVVQSLALGIDIHKKLIMSLLVEEMKKDGIEIRGVYERSDAKVRSLEGMPRTKGFLGKPFDTDVIITENGVKYHVDIENGQKTGFFLDQKYNRLAVSKIARGKRVLDCFTHTGSFALNAAMGGAEHVCAVDISESAIEMAKRNAEANGLYEKMSFRVEDVFDLFPKLEAEHEKFDFIILDPPAFTKSRKTVESAAKGYKEINLRAMKALPRGGYLATCSCSHFMTDDLFVKMLRSAAKDACVELRQIEARQQSPDHPMLWNVPETDYLKFYIFQVI